MHNSVIRIFGFSFFVLVLQPLVSAHELRPGYLQLISTTESEYQVTWKQPTRNSRTLSLFPAFPSDCRLTSDKTSVLSSNFITDKFTIECSSTLVNREIGIVGLAKTLTDVYLRVEFSSHIYSTLLRPESPFTVIEGHAELPTLSYLWVGVEHLMLGFDHLLFLVCLMYLVPRLINLIKAVTAFTVAHSITLILGVLGWLPVASVPIETVIALSILYLAFVATYSDPERISIHQSWWVIFAFGLIHGAGFATALSESGLPQDDLIPALLLFNLGIEIAQIAFIAIIFTAVYCSKNWLRPIPIWCKQLPLSATAGIAVFWLCDRTIQLFGPLF